MVALSRCIGPAALVLASTEAARVSRHKQDEQQASKLVLFHEGTTTSDIREFCNGQCGLMGNPDAGGVAFAQMSGGAGAQMMNTAQAKKVDVFEADGVDEMIPEIENLEMTSTASWGLERVGVPQAQFTGRGQTIYVQDTGVRTTHRDFGGRAFAGLDLTTGRGVVVCDAASTSCSTDRQGHGTHCAGTAAGTQFGVASQAKVIAVKTLSDRGSGARSWQMAAIDWITVNGVKPSVISMSLGGSGQDPAYTKAIGAATAAGITVVVAAGNSNSDSCNFSPAFAADAITVGATTSTNQRASYSNYGRCNNIMAPGSAIVSASSGSNTGSRSLSGTSMACPHVSGAAALLLESNPSLNRDQILSKLLAAGKKGFISGLQRNDPNEFLQVGSLSARAAPDSQLVLFHEGTTTSDIKEFCAGRCGLMGNPDAGGVAFAQLTGVSGAQMMNSAQAKKIDVFEPDAIDEMIPEIENLEIASTASWGLERVGVPASEFTGRGQTIYVQDTGVRTTHRDFGGRAFAGLDLTTNQGVEVCDAASLTCSTDRQGHGTHCAGTAAGTTFGVASQAKVIAVKTLSDQGSGARSWQMAAIDWITANGVKPSVISMSLGGSGSDPAYTKAIGAATAAGITVVVAAGNSNSDSCNFSPAFAADAITVGATTSSNQRASYSNYGSCNNIMAPGSAIVSASSGSNTGSRSLSGTSMACPHVSGAAALLLESNPSLNRDQILQAMIDSSAKGLIAGLKRNDPTEFLWVGSTPPPAGTDAPDSCPLYCFTRLCIASECVAKCDFCA